MALRTKTIEYAFPTYNLTRATGVRNDFAAITISIPETTSRTFRAARIIVSCRDTATAATSLTAPTIGIKLAAVAFSDVNVGNPAANSGESVSYFFQRDVTSYFTTNFGTGASQTCQVATIFTGVTVINISAKIVITYEYDDAATTLVKTVRIPLDSGLGALTATLAEIGTNQIPNLDTFLPETSKVYRSIWFELMYNEFTAGAVNDAQLGMQVDSGTEHLTGLHESSLASSCSGMYLWDQGAAPVWATNAVHAFKLRSSNITTASTFNHVAVVLHVTYEYAASSSTVMNSLVIPMTPIKMPGGTAATDETGAEAELWVEEPATITQVQSGILCSYMQNAAYNPTIKIGTQTARTYTETAMAFCGGAFLTQRTDSGGAGGSAWTIARGLNKLRWTISTSNATAQQGEFAALLLLNYTSGKHASGEGVHNHSTLWSLSDSQTSGTTALKSALAWCDIPETTYFLNGLAFGSYHTIGGAANVRFTIAFEAGASELVANAFMELASASFTADGENANVLTLIPVLAKERLFFRWSGDPQTDRMNPETSRRFYLSCTSGSNLGMFAWLTYHSITYVAAGGITNSAGGTVNLALYDHTTKDVLCTGSRTGNGAYSLTWFDNTNLCFVDAYEDGTHLGRSANNYLA